MISPASREVSKLSPIGDIRRQIYWPASRNNDNNNAGVHSSKRRRMKKDIWWSGELASIIRKLMWINVEEMVEMSAASKLRVKRSMSKLASASLQLSNGAGAAKSWRVKMSSVCSMRKWRNVWQTQCRKAKRMGVCAECEERNSLHAVYAVCLHGVTSRNPSSLGFFVRESVCK